MLRVAGAAGLGVAVCIVLTEARRRAGARIPRVVATTGKDRYMACGESRDGVEAAPPSAEGGE